MLAKNFNFERFEVFCEEKQSLLLRRVRGEYRGPILTQRIMGNVFSVDSMSKERSLEAQLDCLDKYMRLHCDVAYNYLEPWCGVGIYANAFGCPLFWTDIADVQTMPRFHSVDEVANLPYPGDGELMDLVLKYIRYFREQTHDRIPISLTDTQSPCDTASLILDACEFFAVSIEDPEALYDFMEKITTVIGDFSERQIDAIGSELYVAPGHCMISDPCLCGISLSDDNMAVISPNSYRNVGVPWNEVLSRRFGGLAIHSCGVISHNLPQLAATEGLCQLDFKITDFEPNDASLIAKTFANSNILIKACVYPDEDLNRMLPILNKDVAPIIHVFTSGSVDECNRQYDKVALFVHDHYKM